MTTFSQPTAHIIPQKLLSYGFITISPTNIFLNVQKDRTNLLAVLWLDKLAYHLRTNGMIFHGTCKFQEASAITRSCFHQIRNIGRIRSLISVDACRTLVCSLVTSRLDYGNALLYGTNNNKYIPRLFTQDTSLNTVPTNYNRKAEKCFTWCVGAKIINIISKLQRVQNSAARLITQKRKYDSITPVLISRHWLPVHYRCQYKLLITFLDCSHKTHRLTQFHQISIGNRKNASLDV
jgi:hypothetical protein